MTTLIEALEEMGINKSHFARKLGFDNLPTFTYWVAKGLDKETKEQAAIHLRELADSAKKLAKSLEG